MSWYNVFKKLSLNNIVMGSVVLFCAFAISGMFDFINGIATNGKAPMENPILSAFSPVAFMLCLFGFLAVWFLIKGAENLKSKNTTLANKQITAAFFMLLVIVTAYELLLRVPMLL